MDTRDVKFTLTCLKYVSSPKTTFFLNVIRKHHACSLAMVWFCLRPIIMLSSTPVFISYRIDFSHHVTYCLAQEPLNH